MPPPAPRPRSRRSLVIAAAVAAALAFAGCASTAPPGTATSTPSASTAQPSPTPTPTPEHTIAFGGDCSAVLSDDDLAAIVGVETRPREYVGTADVGLRTLGGIECAWQAAEDIGYLADGIYSLIVVVLPTASVSADLRAEASTAACIRIYDGATCTLGADVGGVWVAAQVDQFGNEPPTALLQSTLDTASAHVPGAIAPVALPATGQWWSLGATCEELGERLGLADFLGEGYVTGWWEGDPTLAWTYRVVRDAGATASCHWNPNYGSAAGDAAVYGLTSLTLSPGAGWDQERVLSRGQRVELPGGQSAAVDEEVAVGADGVNVASVSAGQRSGGDPTELLSRVFEVMDGMR